MPSTKRSSKQVARDKAALKRLQKAGYKGRIDLRKAPSKYQLKKIAELSTAKRASKKPAQKPVEPVVKKKRLTEKQISELKEPKTVLTTYALPFLRKGQYEPEWRRFTYNGLRAFINEYKADDPEGGAEWKSYAIRETWTFPPTTLAEAKTIRREAGLYFTGIRISEPSGDVNQRRGPNKKKHRGKR